jgi:hypothetical protein
MARITYKDSLETDRDRVRFSIQDTIEGQGPKPDGGNFTDEELDGVLSSESAWPGAVAACFEVLAGLWAQYVDTTIGPRKEQYSQVARRYQSLAESWRVKYGPASVATAPRTGWRPTTRVDGYSNDIASDE